MTERSSRALGRLLQLVGLAIPPLAIGAELAGRVGLGASMLLAFLGLVVFSLGTRMLPPP
ncbi:MAG: hypothetical protein KatS3mg108_1096 [Isosphaeraceae bacterium]|jgi:hypothetical protein|nr:MAG: hypothetical protein KatS3mg108_1096 [Isosphaeraceae bacterium]